MTPDRVVSQWMDDYFATYEDSKCHLTARGFIMSDLDDQGGYLQWFAMPANEIIDSFAATLDEVTENLIGDLTFMVDQEDLLDQLNIEQNFKIDPIELTNALRLSVIDVLKAMSIYFEVRDLAEQAYYSYDD